MSDFDSWLLRMAEETQGCTPTVIGTYKEPSDGEFTDEKIYNCEECDNIRCEYYKQYA